MTVQSRPVCWHCGGRVENDPIFAAPCDHDQCPSAVFHGLCLMEWREHRNRIEEAARDFFRMKERGDI